MGEEPGGPPAELVGDGLRALVTPPSPLVTPPIMLVAPPIMLLRPLPIGPSGLLALGLLCAGAV